MSQINKDLSKDLRALRHRASELSKGIENIFRSHAQGDLSWNSFINQCSILSQQLMLLQSDFEKGILVFPSKFMVQPLHEHFDCSILGVKKMPIIESHIMSNTQPIIFPQNYIDYKTQKDNEYKNNNNINIKKEKMEQDDNNDDNNNNNNNNQFMRDKWAEQDRNDINIRLDTYNEMISNLYEYNRGITAKYKSKKQKKRRYWNSNNETRKNRK